MKNGHVAICDILSGFRMAARPPSRDQDKFVVRLPDGMRERIKAKADRAGMSMNEAIVWCLDQYFPAPATLAERLDELVGLAAILGQGEETRAGVERMIDELQNTLNKIADEKIPVGADLQALVREKLEQWQIEKAEDWHVEHANPFEDDEIVRKLFDKEADD